VLFTNGAVTQIAFALVVQMMAMWFVGSIHPFGDKLDNSVQQLAHWCMGFTLVSLVLMFASEANRAAGDPNNAINMAGLTFLLVGLSFTVIALGLSSIFLAAIPDVQEIFGYVVECVSLYT
jgi:hypothetical protein